MPLTARKEWLQAIRGVSVGKISEQSCEIFLVYLSFAQI
jgi:hypothetical protein